MVFNQYYWLMACKLFALCCILRCMLIFAFSDCAEEKYSSTDSELCLIGDPKARPRLHANLSHPAAQSSFQVWGRAQRESHQVEEGCGPPRCPCMGTQGLCRHSHMLVFLYVSTDSGPWCYFRGDFGIPRKKQKVIGTNFTAQSKKTTICLGVTVLKRMSQEFHAPSRGTILAADMLPKRVLTPKSEYSRPDTVRGNTAQDL